MYFSHYKSRYETIFAPGIKMLNNGMPLKADTYQSCSNFCNFCLGDEFREGVLLRNGIKQNRKIARLLDIKKFANFVEKAYQNKRTSTPFMDWAIRNKYFIELGTTGETFQEADLYFHTTENFIRICSEYRIPLFINTKLNLICRNEEYKKLLIEYKAPIIICASFSSTDDNDTKIYEPLAPLASERLKTLKELNSYPHIKTIFYISPFLPGVTNKDVNKYVNDMMGCGAIGAHLRDFFLQGGLTQKYFWKQYLEKNKKDMEPFPGGYHVNYECKRDFYFRVSELAKKHNPDFEIVGMKSKWFELNPFHGKMCFDKLPKEFQNGITDFTIIPLLRKIRENLDKPQLLVYDKLGHKKGLINLPEKVRSGEGNINNTMDSGSNCNTPDVQYELDGDEWLRGITWNGWEKDKPSGFIGGLDYIFPVMSDKGYVKENGNYLYAYIPKTHVHLLKDNNKSRLFIPTSYDELKNPYVDILDIGSFLIPSREGNTGDKFFNEKG